MAVTWIATLEVKGKQILWLLLRLRRTPRAFSSIIVYNRPGENVECENDITE